VNILAQTSRKKMHKVPIVGLHKLPICGTQISHLRDTNRTSSLFGLFPGLWEKSVEASPLRWRAASSPPSLKSSWKGVPPFQTIPQKSYMPEPREPGSRRLCSQVFVLGLAVRRPRKGIIFQFSPFFTPISFSTLHTFLSHLLGEKVNGV
jgi:hypothetical protein